MKSPEPRIKAQRKVDYENYDAITWAEIITGNYHRKLSASIYHHAKNVGIIYRDTGVSKKTYGKDDIFSS